MSQAYTPPNKPNVSTTELDLEAIEQESYDNHYISGWLARNLIGQIRNDQKKIRNLEAEIDRLNHTGKTEDGRVRGHCKEHDLDYFANCPYSVHKGTK